MVLPRLVSRSKREKTAAAVFEVEVACRFVGGEDGRIGGEGAGDGDALLLSAGEFGREFVGLVFDFHQAEQFHGAVTAFTEGGCGAKIHGQHHVFERGQRGKQLEELKDHADGTSAPDGELVFAKLLDLFAAD